MKRLPLRAAFISSWFFLSLIACRGATAAVHIVGDGGDLVATVAVAAHNDIIEIHSNQTFVGSLSWSHKFLTIEAGPGYQPTIQGSPFTPDPEVEYEPGTMDEFGRPAVFDVDGNANTGGLFQGVRLLAGANGFVSPDTPPEEVLAFRRAVAFSSTNFNSTQVTFEQCILDGNSTISGTGDYHVEATFVESLFLGEVFLGGTGDHTANVIFESNTLRGHMNIGGTGSANVDILATNNVIYPEENSSFPIGIQAGGAGQFLATGRFVNNTVVGFDIGLSAGPRSSFSFENMLLANDQDIEVLTNSTIANSLIADGTFDGVNGNFAATPLLGPQMQLLPDSPGIDAGNNSALNLPAIDILGNPRIVDGNGDSLARVDVGAYELQNIPEPTSLALAATAMFACAIGNRLGRRSLRS